MKRFVSAVVVFLTIVPSSAMAELPCFTDAIAKINSAETELKKAKAEARIIIYEEGAQECLMNFVFEENFKEKGNKCGRGWTVDACKNYHAFVRNKGKIGEKSPSF